MKYSSMRIFTVALALLGIKALASAVTTASAFVPTYAADQMVINSRSLEAEATQFRALARWHSVEDDVERRRVENGRLLSEYERAKDLAKAGTLSQIELRTRQLAYEQSLLSLQQVASQLASSALTTELARQTVLEEGNPGVDIRAKIVDLRIERTTMERDLLASELESARSTQEYFAQNFKTGEALFAKHVIALVELQDRHSQLDQAINEVEVASRQVEASESILVGLRKAKLKL